MGDVDHYHRLLREVAVRRSFSKKLFVKIHRKTPALESLFNKALLIY